MKYDIDLAVELTETEDEIYKKLCLDKFYEKTYEQIMYEMGISEREFYTALKKIEQLDGGY